MACNFCLQESVEALINCVVENIGFSDGKPVAAVTIYKCLLHWRTFEAERTNVFDRLIQIFSSAMQVFHTSFPRLMFIIVWSCLSYCPFTSLHNLYHRNKTAMLISRTGCQIHHHCWLYCKRVWNLRAQVEQHHWKEQRLRRLSLGGWYVIYVFFYLERAKCHKDTSKEAEPEMKKKEETENEETQRRNNQNYQPN